MSEVINIQALQNLLDQELKDDMRDLLVETISDPDLQSAIERIEAQQKQEAVDAAAQEILKIVKASRVAQEKAVHEIRILRRAVETQKNTLFRIQAAEAYARKTRNYLPLLVQLGLVTAFRLEPEVGFIPKEFMEEFSNERAKQRAERHSQSPQPSEQAAVNTQPTTAPKKPSPRIKRASATK